MLTIGLDSGSTTTKAILYDGNDIVKSMQIPTGLSPVKALKEVYDALYCGDVVRTTTTGYGRDLLEERDDQITEITCHARGAKYLAPDCQGVIDVGGQDSKVICLGKNGRVIDFLMNDKCAAGTGRFIEMTMHRVEQPMDALDTFVAHAVPSEINSMCTVFAESEIIGLMAEGTDPGDIVLGCIHSICKRIAAFSRKVLTGEDMIFFSGGLSRSEVIRSTLEEYMKNTTIITDPMAPFAGAIGAAILGFEKYTNEL